MSLTSHALRFGAELLAGLALAWVITFATMATLFYFGPWANPPGMDALNQTLLILFPALCLWRAYQRYQTSRAETTKQNPEMHTS